MRVSIVAEGHASVPLELPARASPASPGSSQPAVLAACFLTQHSAIPSIIGHSTGLSSAHCPSEVGGGDNQSCRLAQHTGLLLMSLVSCADGAAALCCCCCCRLQPPLGQRRAMFFSGMYGSELTEVISAYRCVCYQLCIESAFAQACKGRQRKGGKHAGARSWRMTQVMLCARAAVCAFV